MYMLSIAASDEWNNTARGVGQESRVDGALTDLLFCVRGLSVLFRSVSAMLLGKLE